MRYKLLNTTSIIALCFFFQACAQQVDKEPKGIIASKNGFELTEKDFTLYLEALEGYALEIGDVQSEEVIKAELKKAFLEDPKNIVNELNALTEIADVPVGTPSEYDTAKTTPTSILAEGHRLVREKLGSDIGKMQFDTQATNNFRAYMHNSLLTSRTNSGSSGYGSSSYSESNAKIQFCANGTYIEALSGYVGIDVDGMSASSGNDTDYIPGYWEVASLPNGMLVILLYSTHPLMLEDNANGLLPFPVAQYTSDFVALPNGDGYSRTINHCN